jgi:Holliday junction resolvasome RuvABC DNA-binding subunit
VATLRGKVTEEALLRDAGFATIPGAAPAAPASVLQDDGIDILVNLGHRRAEAAAKIQAALQRNPEMASPEELIREVYKGERAQGD